MLLLLLLLWQCFCYSVSLGCIVSLLLQVSTSFHFNSHFPGWPGLAGTRMSPFWIILELRVMEMVATTGALRHAKLQSNCHHQKTNTQVFYRPAALHVAKPCQSTEGFLIYKKSLSLKFQMDYPDAATVQLTVSLCLCTVLKSSVQMISVCFKVLVVTTTRPQPPSFLAASSLTMVRHSGTSLPELS